MKGEGNEGVLELELKGERKGSRLGFFCEMVIGEGSGVGGCCNWWRRWSWILMEKEKGSEGGDDDDDVGG